MSDFDPICVTCGKPRSNHPYRHRFKGPSKEDTIKALTAKLAEAEARERDAYARGFEAGLRKAAEWFDENKDDYDRLEPCVVASMLRAIPLPDK